MTSRRQFIGGVTAGAAAFAARPVFSRGMFQQPATSTADGLVHLNYNESPYGPSVQALHAFREAATSCGRYFNDSEYESLRTALARHHGVAAENILIGAGSTEILKLCDDVFLRNRAHLVAAEPAYEAVIHYALNSRAQAVKVPLMANFRHDLPKMAEAVTRDTGMIYICNPNNPTGTIVTGDELARFLDRVGETIPVIVDEAYADFVTSPDFSSAIRHVKQGRNVVVARTFSKAYGMAGMRVGYAIAKRELIELLRPCTVHWAVSGPAALAAAAAVADVEHTSRVTRLNRAGMQTLQSEMKAAGFECIPSQANFAMIHLRRPVAPVIAEFAKRRILVGREFRPMTNYLRVTLGTEAEMREFYGAFREILRG